MGFGSLEAGVTGIVPPNMSDRIQSPPVFQHSSEGS